VWVFGSTHTSKCTVILINIEFINCANLTGAVIVYLVINIEKKKSIDIIKQTHFWDKTSDTDCYD